MRAGAADASKGVLAVDSAPAMIFSCCIYDLLSSVSNIRMYIYIYIRAVPKLLQRNFRLHASWLLLYLETVGPDVVTRLKRHELVPAPLSSLDSGSFTFPAAVPIAVPIAVPRSVIVVVVRPIIGCRAASIRGHAQDQLLLLLLSLLPLLLRACAFCLVMLTCHTQRFPTFVA